MSLLIATMPMYYIVNDIKKCRLLYKMSLPSKPRFYISVWRAFLLLFLWAFVPLLGGRGKIYAILLYCGRILVKFFY